MNLATFDLFLLVLLLISYGLGYRRGIVWQLAGIASLIVGHVAARVVIPNLQDFGVPDYGLYHFGAWVGVYFAAAVAVYLVAWRFRKFLQKKDLADLDKHLGGLLGLLKGGLFFSLITLLAITMSQTVRNSMLKTYTGPVVAQVAKVFENYVPTETLTALEPFYLTKEEREASQVTKAVSKPVKAEDQSGYDLPPWFEKVERERVQNKARQRIKALKKLKKQIKENRQKIEEGKATLPELPGEEGEGKTLSPDELWPSAEPDHEGFQSDKDMSNGKAGKTPPGSSPTPAPGNDRHPK